jgi:hypothetical protein
MELHRSFRNAVPTDWAQSDGTMKLLRAPKAALVVGNGKYKDAPELRNTP